MWKGWRQTTTLFGVFVEFLSPRHPTGSTLLHSKADNEHPLPASLFAESSCIHPVPHIFTDEFFVLCAVLGSHVMGIGQTAVRQKRF